jgi:hypothetical protein
MAVGEKKDLTMYLTHEWLAATIHPSDLLRFLFPIDGA